MTSVHDPERDTAFGELVAFRQEFYESLFLNLILGGGWVRA